MIFIPTVYTCITVIVKLHFNPSAVARSDARPPGMLADGRGFNPHVRQNILSLRFGHEKNSTTILSLPLIQEGQLSVTGERMGTKHW